MPYFVNHHAGVWDLKRWIAPGADDDFKRFKFSWIAWPERHFVAAVTHCLYEPTAKQFSLSVAPARPGAPEPFGNPPCREPLADSFQQNLRDCYQDGEVLVWLITEDTPLAKENDPARRLELDASLTGSLFFDPRSTAGEARITLKASSLIWMEDLETIEWLLVAQELDNSPDARLSGRFESRERIDRIFADIESAIRHRPRGVIRNVDANQQERRIEIHYYWEEVVGLGRKQEAPWMKLTLQFSEAADGGTDIDFNWKEYTSHEASKELVCAANRAIALPARKGSLIIKSVRDLSSAPKTS
ncbi:MAG: hypothetical protein ACRDHZ_04240 [Ktedonobacteraceae bacterium]